MLLLEYSGYSQVFSNILFLFFPIIFQFTSNVPSQCDIDMILFCYTWVPFFIRISKYQYSLVIIRVYPPHQTNEIEPQRRFPTIIDSNHFAHCHHWIQILQHWRINPKTLLKEDKSNFVSSLSQSNLSRCYQCRCKSKIVPWWLLSLQSIIMLLMLILHTHCKLKLRARRDILAC